MARTSKTEQELNYLRSAWEEVEFAAVENHFKIEIRMSPTISRGVWAIEMVGTCTDKYGDKIPPIREMAVFRFPNGRLVTFAGELWSVLHKFNIQLEEALDNWKRATGYTG